MDLIQHIYQLFQNGSIQPEEAEEGWNVKKELKKLKKHSPVPLPEDYCYIFLEFCKSGHACFEDGQGTDEETMPVMYFLSWDDIDDLVYSVTEDEFWKTNPHELPFANDMGDTVYIYRDDGNETGIYITEDGCMTGHEAQQKVAGSFTELFTDPRTRRRFCSLCGVGYYYDEDEWNALFSVFGEKDGSIPKGLEQFSKQVPADILIVADGILAENAAKWLEDGGRDTPIKLANMQPYGNRIVKANLMEIAYNKQPHLIDYDALYCTN